jgi:hypothetical protein
VFPLLAFVLLGIIYEQKVENAGIFILMNGVIILLQLLLLTIYFSIKERKLVSIINAKLGLGDVLLLFVLCLSFFPTTFLIFLSTSLIFSLSLHLIIRKQFKEQVKIPLAAYIAIYYVLFVSTLLFLQLSPYQDILEHYLITLI